MTFNQWQPARAGLCALMLTGTVQAAEADWEHTLALYMVGAGIDGEAGVGPVTGDVDVSFGDILDNLEFGAMGAYRAERGPWAITADLIFMSLEQDDDGLGPLGRTDVKVEADQLITELDGSYRLTDSLDAYVGLRYWDLESEVHIAGGGPLGETLHAKATEDWIDPLIGLRYEWPFADRWALVSRADVGGFGVGSDFAWHATIFASWAWTDNATLLIGYRHLDVDYDEGEGSGRFLWDVSEGGPTAGFAWRF